MNVDAARNGRAGVRLDVEAPVRQPRPVILLARDAVDGDNHLGRGEQRIAAPVHRRRARVAVHAGHGDLQPAQPLDAA